MEIRWKGGLSCLVKRSRLKRLGRQTFVVVAVVGVGIGRGSRLVQAPGPEGRERGKDPRSTAGIQCREGVEMDSESGVVEVGRSPRGRKWGRVTGPREGGEGGRKKRGSGGRSPDGENIHTSIHVRCVAWLCRCVLDLVAANAAHLLCPWWIFCRCLVPCSEWAGLPLAKDRPPMDRHAQAHSQGTLERYPVWSCPPAASCPPHAARPHGPRASAPQRDAPGQSRAPGSRLSNEECHWSHAGQPRQPRDRRRGDLWTVFQFPCTGRPSLPVGSISSSSRRAFRLVSENGWHIPALPA